MAAALQQLPLDVPLRIALSKPENMDEFVSGLMGEANPTTHFAWWLGHLLWDRSSPSDVAELTLSLKAIASRFNDPITAEVLRGELENRDAQRMATRPVVLLSAIKRLGRRVKPELAMSDAEGSRLGYLLLDTMVLGSYLNARAGCSDLSKVSPLRPDGEDGGLRWTTASIATLALLNLVTEDDPDATRSSVGERVNDDVAPDADPVQVLERRIDESAMLDRQAPVMPGADGLGGQRRSRDELKRLVLTAGQELFLRDGLALQPEALRYSAVLGHLRESHGIVVNRASLHGRIWNTHNDFCLDVISRGLGQMTPFRSPPATDVTRRREEYDSAEGSWRTLFDRVRQSMLSRVQEMAESGQFRQRLLVKASLFGKEGSAAMDNLCTVLRRTDTERLDRNVERTAQVLEYYGFEVKPELGLTHDDAVDLTTQITQFVVIGSVFNQLCGIGGGTQTFRIGRGDGSDETDEWNLAGLAVRGCLAYFFRHHTESA